MLHMLQATDKLSILKMISTNLSKHQAGVDPFKATITLKKEYMV